MKVLSISLLFVILAIFGYALPLGLTFIALLHIYSWSTSPILSIEEYKENNLPLWGDILGYMAVISATLYGFNRFAETQSQTLYYFVGLTSAVVLFAGDITYRIKCYRLGTPNV